MKPTTKWAWLVCALLVGALNPVAAQAPAMERGNRISLEEALGAAEEANLELRVAREQLAAAEA
ncbi:MAG: hypothetical protein GEU90_19580, partial [Gemmatimonas sp.]|nr:hypothetical protein [Gemmatimonas sp.]